MQRAGDDAKGFETKYGVQDVSAKKTSEVAKGMECVCRKLYRLDEAMWFPGNKSQFESHLVVRNRTRGYDQAKISNYSKSKSGEC